MLKVVVALVTTIVAGVFAIALVVAIWPMIPAIGVIVIGGGLGLAFAAGVVGIYWLWIKAESQRIEAGKIHADHSAFYDRGKLVALPQGQLGYGTVSGLHNFAPRLQFEQLILPPVSQVIDDGRTDEHSTANPTTTATATPTRPITAQEALALLPPDRLAWCFGINEEGEPVTSTISEAVHVLNVGGTGQGKTTLTANLLLQLVTVNRPDRYHLLIADIKGTLTRPFKPYCLLSTTQPTGYLEVMATARQEVDRRRNTGEFQAPLMLVVVEEALALKRYLEPKLLAEYARHLDVVALVGREYGVFLLACSQVDYSSKDFQNSRGQFMTRLAGAILPSAAASMGFVNRPLINRLWQERRPGQFLIESPAGDNLIRTPLLDLKGGELTRLLAAHAPYNKPTSHHHTAPWQTQTPSATQQVPSANSYATDPFTSAQNWAKTGEVVNATFRELPAAPGEVEHFARAWKKAGGSIRQAIKELDLTYYQGQKLYQQARQSGLIERPLD